MAPFWQVSPPSTSSVNFDLLSDPIIASMHQAMVETQGPVLRTAKGFSELWDFVFDPSSPYKKDLPHYYLLEPVYANMDDSNKRIVGFLLGLTDWKTLFTRVVPTGAPKGIVLVVSSDCDETLSFELDGPNVAYLGPSDMHDPSYDQYEQFTNIELNNSTVDGLCLHELRIYPTSEFRDSYQTNNPVLFTCVVAGAFALTALLLLLYDYLVNRRQNKTLASALKSDELISSLFPEQVREQLMKEDDKDGKGAKGPLRRGDSMDTVDDPSPSRNTKLIADNYPEATVFFGKRVTASILFAWPR